jgi:hypothetical protein
VKIHGHRIELGEIAAVLNQHSSVSESIVIKRTEISGDERLIAYFVPKFDHAVDVRDLQDFVRKKLPAYMTPAAFVRLERVPLTASGKIDRKALPDPEDICQLVGYVAPRNEMEEILADIWESVLQVEKVGIHENFFDLGGASIQSLQVVASASLAGLHLKVESIFEHQTIAELAEQLEKY